MQLRNKFMYYLCIAPQALKSTHGKTAHNSTLYSRLHTSIIYIIRQVHYINTKFMLLFKRERKKISFWCEWIFFSSLFAFILVLLIFTKRKLTFSLLIMWSRHVVEEVRRSTDEKFHFMNGAVYLQRKCSKIRNA